MPVHPGDDRRLQIALLWWPLGSADDVVGRLDDTDLVQEAKRRLVKRCRRDLVRLDESHLRVVAPEGESTD